MKTTRDEIKKARERQQLLEVAEIYEKFPIGNIIDSESPDFLIQSSDKIIGVELVDYVRGQAAGDAPDRRNERLWEMIADEAKTVFESQHNESLEVIFHWYAHRYPRKSEISRLANEAVSIIEANIPLGLFEHIKVYKDQLGEGKLSHFAFSLHIIRAKNSSQTMWSAINSGWPSVSQNELQTLIDKKDGKISEYLGNCDFVWLLVVADGGSISTLAHLETDVINSTYYSNFTNVLFYDQLDKKVLALNLVAKP